jgi:hypothetical protein
MEQFKNLETDKKELPRPSLGEEMSKLLASMDPQGLLNVVEQEESHIQSGVDPSKAGDAHAEAHEVSLTDGGSKSDPDPKKKKMVESRKKWTPTLRTFASWTSKPVPISSQSR